jgi:asparagine synthase (glutamine-hydrolysing)
MCGIAGWVDRPGAVSRRVVEAMAAAQAHRGPDGCGAWNDEVDSAALAHRRLAILDLSAAAAQPLANEDRTAWLVFNGEIYNFRALRAELEAKGHRFHSHTDSEVILHGWEEWGANGVVSRLRGMFAFAIWDNVRKRLLLARDRFGIKPLYLATLPGGGLAFASEARALLVHPAIGRGLDPVGLRAYLSYGYVPAETCIFSGVRKLRAGMLVEWCAGEEKERSYWELEYRPPAASLPFEEAVAELQELLAESVRLRLQADVPVGSFLSGGVDSSAVTTLAAAHYPEGFSTFCIAFPEAEDDQDAHFARRVAAHLGTRHSELSLRADEACDLLTRMPAVLDEPIADAAILPTYLVSRLARKLVTVVLSGTGGDEVFAGYGWVKSGLRYAAARGRLGPLAGPLGAVFARLVPLLRAFPPGNRLPGIAKILGATQSERAFYLRGYFDAWDQRRLLGGSGLRPTEVDDHLWLYRRFARPDWPLVPALLFHDLKSLITDNELALLDRTTMAHGLEARVPLLDHVMVERVFSLPWSYEYANGKGKKLLRAAVTPLLQPEILSRRKFGFTPPFRGWLREGGRLAAMAAALPSGRLVEDGVLSRQGLGRVLARGALRRTDKKWLLLNLEAWYRHWIRNEPAAPPGTSLAEL